MDNNISFYIWFECLKSGEDYNFEYSLKKIRDEKYIEKLIDRIDYKDEQTKKRMEYLKITAIEDINKKINKEEQKWRKKVLDYGL